MSLNGNFSPRNVCLVHKGQPLLTNLAPNSYSAGNHEALIRISSGDKPMDPL